MSILQYRPYPDLSRQMRLEQTIVLTPCSTTRYGKSEIYHGPFWSGCIVRQ